MHIISQYHSCLNTCKQADLRWINVAMYVCHNLNLQGGDKVAFTAI